MTTTYTCIVLKQCLLICTNCNVATASCYYSKLKLCFLILHLIIHFNSHGQHGEGWRKSDRVDKWTKAIKLKEVTAAFASVSFQLPFLIFLMRCIFCDSPLAWLILSLILLFVIHMHCPFFHSCVHLTFCSLCCFCVDVIMAQLDETVH